MQKKKKKRQHQPQNKNKPHKIHKKHQKMPAPSLSMPCSISYSPTQLATRLSSPLANCAFRPFLLGACRAANDPVFPSTAVTSDNVSRLPMTSRNSELV